MYGHHHGDGDGQSASCGNGEQRDYLQRGVCDLNGSGSIDLHVESGHRFECDHRGERQRLSDCDHILYSNGNVRSGLYFDRHFYGNG